MSNARDPFVIISEVKAQVSAERQEAASADRLGAEMLRRLYETINLPAIFEQTELIADLLKTPTLKLQIEGAAPIVAEVVHRGAQLVVTWVEPFGACEEFFNDPLDAFRAILDRDQRFRAGLLEHRVASRKRET